jgi:Skp family chaperone for outer membrane proteins
MKQKIGAIVLAGGLLLGSASTASAIQVRGGESSARVEQQQNDAKRALRSEIRARQQEYRALRQAGDPRAAQVQQDVRALQAEWTRLYGNDEGIGGERRGEARGHAKGKGHAKAKGKGHLKHRH